MENKYSWFTNLRGRGLMIAFDMGSIARRNNFIKKCFETQNIIVLPCGSESVRFRPVLDLNKYEIDDAIDRIEKVLSTL